MSLSLATACLLALGALYTLDLPLLPEPSISLLVRAKSILTDSTAEVSDIFWRGVVFTREAVDSAMVKRYLSFVLATWVLLAFVVAFLSLVLFLGTRLCSSDGWGMARLSATSVEDKERTELPSSVLSISHQDQLHENDLESTKISKGPKVFETDTSNISCEDLRDTEEIQAMPESLDLDSSLGIPVTSENEDFDEVDLSQIFSEKKRHEVASLAQTGVIWAGLPTPPATPLPVGNTLKEILSDYKEELYYAFQDRFYSPGPMVSPRFAPTRIPTRIPTRVAESPLRCEASMSTLASSASASEEDNSLEVVGSSPAAPTKVDAASMQTEPGFQPAIESTTPAVEPTTTDVEPVTPVVEPTMHAVEPTTPAPIPCLLLPLAESVHTLDTPGPSASASTSVIAAACAPEPEPQPPRRRRRYRRFHKKKNVKQVDFVTISA